MAFAIDRALRFSFTRGQMKALLACLMCLLLPAAECFALRGGPPYPAGTNIVGTYAGVLIGPPNELGIFSLGIPRTGLASGSVALFTGQRAFVGTIQGVGDPDRATLRAVLRAIPVVMQGDTTVTTLGLHADGSVDATIRTPRTSSIFSSTRLDGTSSITTSVTGGPEVTPQQFVVDGFKQSSTAPGS